MSREVVISSAFKKDLKKLRAKDTGRLKQLIGLLADEIPLPAGYRDHALVGQWKGYRDAHIEPDWLLIYRVSCQNRKPCGNIPIDHISPARHGVMNHAEKADTQGASKPPVPEQSHTLRATLPTRFYGRAK